MRIVIAVSLCMAASAQAKDKASLEDLNVLAQHGSFTELLERAEDVPPASRAEPWRVVVTAAAAGAVAHAPVGKDPFDEAREADRLRARFPFVEARDGFVCARDEAILKGLARCTTADDSKCLQSFEPYEMTLGAAGSLKAGKLLRRAGFVAYRPMALFARATGAKDAPACKDGDVADAVSAALDLPADTDAAKAARKVAFEWCWTALQGPLKTQMKSASAARLQNSCGPMRAKKALTAMQEELCQDEEHK